jgi:PadR family transcriptional regulator, regulatory protein PadR
MPKQLYLGEFELVVMRPVIRLGEGAYGVPVYRKIEEQTGRGASFGRFTPLSTGWKGMA